MRPLALLIVMLTSIAEPAVAEPTALRVMSYNVNHANRDASGTMDAIVAEDPDVVLLQEIDRGWQDSLEKRFSKAYPHRAFRLYSRAAGGLAVLSRFPIIDEEFIPTPPQGWFPAQRLVVDGPFGKVQMLNVHLRPCLDSGGWITGYQTTPPHRLEQAKAYYPRLKSGLPTVVAGDFNELPTGVAVEYLAKRGLVRVPTVGPTTWHHQKIVAGKPLSLLSMDIDHVLVDSSLVASDAKVVDAGASDHRPVVVTLAKK
ncbi:MAG: endonuclease/exonuclease/phosphatase family protein [Deltaproteobacteria bacterium]|nr:endonuclease/exonuclease/phosphatase family protein [Deltaproteobacteria bacterium]